MTARDSAEHSELFPFPALRALRASVAHSSAPPVEIRHFILVDYENVQPSDFSRLAGRDVEMWIFVGQQQKNRLPFDLVEAVVASKRLTRLVAISGSGRNALDFHLAFYAGRLAAAHPGAAFHLVSRDRGFDPLVVHLREMGHAAHRTPDLPAASALPPAEHSDAVPSSAPEETTAVSAAPKTTARRIRRRTTASAPPPAPASATMVLPAVDPIAELLTLSVRRLEKAGPNGRPKTRRRLESSLAALPPVKPSADLLAEVIGRLVEMGTLSFDDKGRVSYPA